MSVLPPDAGTGEPNLKPAREYPDRRIANLKFNLQHFRGNAMTSMQEVPLNPRMGRESLGIGQGKASVEVQKRTFAWELTSRPDG